MNKTYRLIWNDVRQSWTVTHEAASSRGKPASKAKPLAAVLAGALLMHGGLAQAIDPTTLPTGGQVVSGQASISQSGSAMTINQGSDQAILNWNSFSIGSGASVEFLQPSSSSVALNRVIGTDPSAIYGSLTANGQVFLVNPNGVLFGQGARVDVGGLVASTLSIRDEDFLAGNNRFSRDGATGSVVNQGGLYGRYVALLAPEVRNEGVIVAQQGTVALAAGEAVTLNITGNRLIGVQVDQASLDTLVENKHLIQADDGMVVMSAQSANGLIGRVVNTGAVEARGIVNDGGVIRLLASSDIEHSGSINADAGTNGQGGSVILMADLANPDSRTVVSGSISARGGSASGDGGFVETSGSHLTIADSTRIDTSATNGRIGQWLLDPVDFTIAAANGDITGAALGTLLESNSVTIQTTTGTNTASNLYGTTGTNGDIFVNDSITWTSTTGTTLTFKADRNIEINAPITVNAPSVSGNNGLVFEYAQGGGAGDYYVYHPVNLASGTVFQTKNGGNAAVTYTVITDKAGLAGLTTNDNTVRYALGSNIDAAGGWTPIGSSGSPFDGWLEGLGHSISNLSTTNTANQQYVGLFGAIGANGQVQNLGLTGVNVAGNSYVGALAGANYGTIKNVYATGSVTGSDIDGTFADTPVYAIGGLIGYNEGSIATSYANVAVTATTGQQTTGDLTDGGIGGLVGVHHTGGIDNTYAVGNVQGVYNVGGLVGYAMATVSNSYARGTVTGTTNVGALVGGVNPAFNGGPGCGFFCPPPIINNSFWDTDVNPGLGGGGIDVDPDAFANASSNATGLTTAGMKTQSNFTSAGWDFTNTWLMYEGVSYPLLRAFLHPYILTAVNQNKTYDGQTLTGGGGSFTYVSNIATPGAVNVAGMTYGAAATATDYQAGGYAITPTGVVLTNDAARQDQHGYLIRTASGTLTINQKTLTVTGLAAQDKPFDGNATATVTGTPALTGVIAGDAGNVSVGGSPTGTFDSADQNTGKTVTVAGLSLSGTRAHNYQLALLTLTADITAPAQPPAPSASDQLGSYQWTQLTFAEAVAKLRTTLANYESQLGESNSRSSKGLTLSKALRYTDLMNAMLGDETVSAGDRAFLRAISGYAGAMKVKVTDGEGDERYSRRGKKGARIYGVAYLLARMKENVGDNTLSYRTRSETPRLKKLRNIVEKKLGGTLSQQANTNGGHTLMIAGVAWPPAQLDE